MSGSTEGDRTTADIESCARCGGDHPGLVFEHLDNPIVISDNSADDLTHWAPCPTNGQPILMREVP